MDISFLEYQEELEKVATRVNITELYGKSILITGASGLIGSTIIDLLVFVNRNNDANIKLFGLSRSLEKLEKRFKYRVASDNLNLISSDVSDLVNINEVYDYIIHAASNADPYTYALYPVETITTNIIGTTHLLNYLKKNPNCKMIFTSTVEVYGSKENVNSYNEDEYGEIDFNLIRSGYPESKRVSELLCKSYVQQYNVKCVIARLGYIYGPTMDIGDSKVVAQFIKNAINKENIIMKSKGEQTRSYCYVLDAVTGILTALLRGEIGNAYNVADKNSIITIKELAELVSSIVRTEVKFELPNELEKKGFSKSNDAILNTEKLKLLGWESLTNIETGIASTIKILSNKSIRR